MNYKIVKLQGLDSQKFISQQYYKNRDLSERSYKEQNIYFVNLITSFSAKNFINSHKEAGNDVEVIFWNNYTSQNKWLEENKASVNKKNWTTEIILHQLKSIKPDVLFFQNVASLSYKIRKEIKNIVPSIKIVLINEDYPGAYQNFSECDILIVNTPILKYRYKYLKPHLIYNSFDENLLKIDGINNVQKKYNLGFLGSLRFPESRYYFVKDIKENFNLNMWTAKDLKIMNKKPRKRNFNYFLSQLIKSLVKLEIFRNLVLKFTPIIFSTKISEIINLAHLEKVGKKKIPNINFKIHEKENFNWLKEDDIFNELHGLEYYKAIKQTKVLINRHADVAANTVDNMKMFEITGMGSCLVTDKGENLSELFEDGKEVVTYNSLEEAKEKIKFLLDNPKTLAEIALNGQKKTLAKHTSSQRNLEIQEIINNQFKYV